MTGSFGSLVHNDGDGLAAVFGEVFEALDDFQSDPAYQCQSGVTARREDLRRVADVGARLILAAGHVADVMQPVFDGPVRPRQRQQLGWPGLFGFEAGDRTHGLDRLPPAHDAFARDTADLRRSLPLRCQQITQ